MFGKKVVTSMLLIATIISMMMIPAYADCHEGVTPFETEFEDGTYFATGIANFILNQNARVIGIKEPGEKVQKLEYQHSEYKIPTGNLPNGFIREKAIAKVMADDGEYLLGTTQVEVAITIYPEHVSLVYDIVGNLTAESIIAATITREQICDRNSYCGHRFFVEGQACPIGTVTFKDKSFAYIYAGDWNHDCRVELGFKAGYQVCQKQEEPSCYWDPCHSCWVQTGCGKGGYYTYTVYVHEEYTYCEGGYGYYYQGGKCQPKTKKCK